MISILYVDDEEMLLDICKIYLERSGNLQVTTSNSAKMALELMGTVSFDAIISDYQMPGMDGIEFLKAIRKENKKIPFIIFTGRGREEVVIEALKEGADFYLQKGGDPHSQFAELRNHVEQIVRQRKAESDLVFSETLYHTLFETAQDAIFLMEKGLIIECNHRTLDLFSASMEQIIGKNPADFSPEFQVDGQRSLEKALNYIQIALDGTPQYFEWRLKKSNGSVFDVEVSLNRIEVKGKYLLLSIVRDISEHKRILNELERKTDDLGASYEEILATEEELRSQYVSLSKSEHALKVSEEKLRSTLASIDDLVLTLDENGVFLEAYKEKSDEYFISPELFIGHHFRDILPPHFASLLSDSLDRVMATRQTDKITYSMNISGEIRYYNAKLSIRLNAEGNVAGVTLVARDVTDERKYQRALSENKTKLEAVIQGNPIPQFVIDKNHQVTNWNAALAQYSGIPAHEVIGTNKHWRAFYPEERPCLADILIDGKQDLLSEWYPGKYSESKLVQDAFEAFDFFPRMGESGKWLYFTAALIRDEHGEIIGAVETLEDITEQKEAFRQLKREEAILNSVIQESPIPEFVIDKNHQVMFWNRALSLYSGIPASEVMGTHTQWRAFYPNERPCLADLLVDHSYQEIEQWYKGKYSPSQLIPDAYEAVDFFPDLGPEGRWLYFTAALIRDNAREVIGAVEILEDISKQKIAQDELLSVTQYLESIIHNANVWLMVLDPDTNVVIWNQAAEEMSGYSAGEVIGSQWIWEALYPEKEYRKKIFHEIMHIISENQHMMNFDTCIHAKNGSNHTISWNTRALRNPNNDITGYVAVGIEKCSCK